MWVTKNGPVFGADRGVPLYRRELSSVGGTLGKVRWSWKRAPRRGNGLYRFVAVVPLVGRRDLLRVLDGLIGSRGVPFGRKVTGGRTTLRTMENIGRGSMSWDDLIVSNCWRMVRFVYEIGCKLG